MFNGMKNSIFIIILLSSFNVFSYEINQEVYLNACGPNPQEYYDEPLVLNNLKEVPNKIISLEKSEFDRAFQTRSISEMEYGGEIYTAQLNDFRYFKITDQLGNILIDRKVSGATSIYEISFQNNLIAWGVGWHKYKKFCSDDFYYPDVDFTVLRLFIPTIMNGVVSFDDENVLSPSFSNVSLSERVSSPVIVDKSTILGPYGAADLHYKAINLFIIENNELKELTKLDDLNKFNIGSNLFEAPIYLHWLSRYTNTSDLQKFINDNYNEIVEFELGDVSYDSGDVLKNKSLCKSKKFLTRKELAQNCFPSIDEDNNNQYESLIGSRYDKLYFSNEGEYIFESIGQKVNIYNSNEEKKIISIDKNFLNIDIEYKGYYSLSLSEVTNNSFQITYDNWGETKLSGSSFLFKISDGNIYLEKDIKI